jgi:S-formylglutathione hydrolase
VLRGTQRFIAHDSRECGTEMRFSVYLPPQSRKGPVPVLYYLAGSRAPKRRS